MKKIRKISDVFKIIFGYGIMICLFGGGATFFGYAAALLIGGETAAKICEFIYKQFIPVIIYASSILVLFGLVIMYMRGEIALSASKKKK